MASIQHQDTSRYYTWWTYAKNHPVCLTVRARDVNEARRALKNRFNASLRNPNRVHFLPGPYTNDLAPILTDLSSRDGGEYSPTLDQVLAKEPEVSGFVNETIIIATFLDG